MFDCQAAIAALPTRVRLRILASPPCAPIFALCVRVRRDIGLALARIA